MGEGMDPTETPALSGTYYEDVAPILARNCLGCHQEGGIAPFVLGDFESAVKYGPASKIAVEARTMPPWQAGNGRCQTFKDARWLSDEEITTVSAWVDGGMKRRSVDYVPPASTATDDLPEAYTLADTGGEYTPQGSSGHPVDDYRCFLLQPGLTRDMFMTAYQVVPGEAREVHHVTVYTLLAGTEADAKTLDAQDEAAGWPCFSGAGEGLSMTSFLVAWGPGTPTTHLPEGTGIRVSPDVPLVLQVHYNISNGQWPDHTRIRVELQDSVETEGYMIAPGPFDFSLPPGQAETSVDVSMSAREFAQVLRYKFGVSIDSFDVWSIFPHMHTRGTKLYTSVGPAQNPANATQCLVDVQDWDFHWQQSYFYVEPIPVSLSEGFYVKCTYDTTAETEPIVYGEGTEQEMCISAMYVTPGL